MDTKGFLSLIFQEGDIIEFKPFWPGSRGEERTAKGLQLTKGREWFPLHKINDAILQRYHNINREGYGIYFGVNPRKTIGGGKNEDVELGRVLCADFDAKDFPNGKFDLNFIKKKISDSGFPTPTFKTNTGGGFHCYWILSESIMPEEWREMQERLNATISADPTIKDPVRVMRLPGYKNTKIKENPRDAIFLEAEFYPENIFSVDFLKEKLIEASAKEASGYTEKDFAAGRPTWIEEEIKRLNLINPGEHISSKGEVMVASCDPTIESTRTSINIFTGKWENKSHDSHPELKNNGWRDGDAGKYFTGHYMKRYEKEKGKKILYKKADAESSVDLLNRYGKRFEKWMEERNARFKKFIEDKAKEVALYNPSEEELKVLREQMVNGKITNLELSLKNPTKSAFYLWKIFYNGKDIIHRHDYEVYGEKNATGEVYKFFRPAIRRELVENTYKLLRFSVQPSTIGVGLKAVEILLPITNAEPKHVKMILERMESLPGIYYSPVKYIVPIYKDGRKYDQESVIPFNDYDWDWIEKKKVEDASSDVILHGRLAYNRVEGAQLSKLAKDYLESVFSKETIELIRNVMLYLVTMQHTEQKMFYIQGKQGRGKGVLFHIIVELIGRHNYSLVSPATLASENGLLEAEGKMLGGCADARWGGFTNRSSFLAQQLLGVINREPVSIKKLYKNKYKVIMDFRLLLVGEFLPSELKAAGIHLNDKIIVIPVKEGAPNFRLLDNGKGDNKKLRELLTTPEELAGWFEWALGGDLNDIRNREEGELQIEIMSKTQSPPFNWIECCIDFDPNYHCGQMIKDAARYSYITSLSDAFNSMLYFCERKQEYYKESETKFKGQLESLLEGRAEYQQVNYSKTNRKMKYTGFRIKQEWKHNLPGNEVQC